MTLEETFRWCLLAALLAVLPIVAYHRIKAHRAGGSLDRRQEGLFILATLRPIGLVFFVSQWHRFGQQQATSSRQGYFYLASQDRKPLRR
jgi:hypothetical protein